MQLTDVTQLWCPNAATEEGTHHFIPRGPMSARSQTCRDCGKTEKQIRESIRWFINEDGEVYDYPADTQPLLFPGDDHTAYATKAEAVRASEREIGPEKWVHDALDQQEAYVAEQHGALHRPESAGPDDEEDWRRCGTCGTDLYSIFMCPDAPVGRCGCPLYLIRDNDHQPHI